MTKVYMALFAAFVALALAVGYYSRDTEVDKLTATIAAQNAKLAEATETIRHLHSDLARLENERDALLQPAHREGLELLGYFAGVCGQVPIGFIVQTGNASCAEALQSRSPGESFPHMWRLWLFAQPDPQAAVSRLRAELVGLCRHVTAAPQGPCIGLLADANQHPSSQQAQ